MNWLPTPPLLAAKIRHRLAVRRREYLRSLHAQITLELLVAEDEAWRALKDVCRIKEEQNV